MKAKYESPAAKVVEMKMESLICESTLKTIAIISDYSFMGTELPAREDYGSAIGF